jgi:Flp pilus assembly protein TadB
VAQIVLVTFVLAVFAVIALLDRPWAWLPFALIAGSLAVALAWPSYLRRRITLLADDYA